MYIWFNVTGETSNYSRTIEACGIPPSESDSTANNRKDIYACPQLEARKIGIQLNQGFDLEPFYSDCQIATQYVETKITCANKACFANRIRQSLSPHLSRNWTILDVMQNGPPSTYEFPDLFFGNMANSIAGHMTGDIVPGSTALVGYIADPSSPFSSISLNPAGLPTTPPTLFYVKDPVITSRLTQILNSYWMTTAGSQLITGDITTWLSIQANRVALSFSIHTDPDIPMIVAATGNVSTPHQKPHCSMGWLTAFTAISLFALLSAITGLILALKTSAPRLSMNISSILRDSRYSDIGTKGSYLDDSVRSAMGQNMIVRIGDVSPSEAVGHIAVSSASSEGAMSVLGKLRKDRLYE